MLLPMNTGSIRCAVAVWSLQNLEDIIEMAEAVAGGAEALRRSPFCALYS